VPLRSCRLSASLLLALLLTLPFLGARHHLPIATFRQEWLAGVLGLGMMLVLATAGGKWEVPRSVALPVALIVLLWLQFAAGLDVVYTQVVLASLYLAWSALLMVSVSRLEQLDGREALADRIAWALLGGSLLAAAGGIVQVGLPQIGLPWIFPSGGRAIGNLAQANSYADYLWLGIASTAYLYARQRLSPALLLPALVPLVALSLLSGSRSVYFYAAALTAWLIVWAVLRDGGERRRLLLGAVAILPLLLTVQWGLALGSATAISSAQRLATEGSYDPVRLTLWRAAFDIFNGHRWLGAGFDSFSREFFARIDRFPIGGMGIPEHSHNLATEIAAEFGLTGLLALAAAAIGWLVALRRRADNPTFLAIGGLLILGIHSALEYPLWYAHFLAIASILLALGDGSRRSFAASGRHRVLIGGVAACGLVILLGMRTDYLNLEEAAQGRRGDGTPLLASAQRDGLLDSYAHSLWRPYAALQFAARMPIDEEEVTERLALVDEAIHFSPIRAAVFRHAALLQLDGQSAAAQRQLARAMRAYPGNIDEALRQLQAAAIKAPALQPLVDQLRQRNF